MNYFSYLEIFKRPNYCIELPERDKIYVKVVHFNNDMVKCRHEILVDDDFNPLRMNGKLIVPCFEPIRVD
jgi:hypothetical protein